MSVLSEFKDALHAAISNYEHKKMAQGSRHISVKRCGDITAIQKIIDGELYDPEIIRAGIRLHFVRMTTGFWGIQTGHSTLKEGLIKVMRQPQFQDIEFLRATFPVESDDDTEAPIELGAGAGQINLDEAQEYHDDEHQLTIRFRARIRDLEATVRHLTRTMREQEAQVELLEQDNTRLRQKNARLHGDQMDKGSSSSWSPSHSCESSSSGM